MRIQEVLLRAGVRRNQNISCLYPPNKSVTIITIKALKAKIFSILNKGVFINAYQRKRKKIIAWPRTQSLLIQATSA
jgi:hypothetical protein